MLRLTNLKIKLDRISSVQEEAEILRSEILSRLKLKPSDLFNYKIYKKSIDARNKEEITIIYTLDMEVAQEEKILSLHSKRQNLTITPDLSPAMWESGTEKNLLRPVIIGMGPAGMFAGLYLSRYGYRPIILERGEDVDSRTLKVNTFWQEGKLDPQSNVQFGEGGAGTFSDGKLTTLINDKRSRIILEEFIKAGAPPEILYVNKAHIGTDLLKIVVKRIREEIIKNGGEVRFNALVTDFVIKDTALQAVIINHSEQLPCTSVLLGIGHSARDTFQVLDQRGVRLSPKSFSIGVRIEHPQSLIDQAQYGRYAGHPGLGAADYKLVYHAPNGRSAYTFCMCPGGYVVGAASEEGGVVTNGMSEYSRNGTNANAALLVGVSPADFGSDHPLAGVEFQRKWERLAFQNAGQNYKAPTQLAGDFLKDKPSIQLGSVVPTYQPGVILTELKNCLPAYAVSTIREALLYFDKLIHGYAQPDALLTGVETRSSSPVRINRSEDYQANISGLYPMGEGAGYAGGIMSSALDGLRTAEKFMTRFLASQR